MIFTSVIRLTFVFIFILVMPLDGHAVSTAANDKLELNDLPASMVVSKERPNAPSLATTTTHRKLSVDDW